MKYVRVTITRWVSDQPQPGIVECELVDARGRVWTFHEKTQVLSDKYLWSDSVYPQPGVIAVTVCDGQLADATELDIDTAGPWFVEAVDGTHRFRVPAGAVVDDPGW